MNYKALPGANYPVNFLARSLREPTNNKKLDLSSSQSHCKRAGGSSFTQTLNITRKVKL